MKKLQIFVSSTYTDLIEERQTAIETILRAHHIPAGMELFSAGNDSQLKVIERWIDESDLFMLILGGKYGSIEPRTGNSYIQVEYEYAIQQEVPVFALVLTDNYLKRKGKILVANGGDIKDIYELNNRQKYQDFKNTVLGRICKFCDNTEHIQIGIFQSLNDFTNDPYYRFRGWVRGSEMEKFKNQLSTCTDENQKFKQEIKKLKQEKEHLETLASNCELPETTYNIHLLEVLEKSSLKSAFRIKVDNHLREARVKELVDEELARSGQKTFRLVASSGANYLNAQGRVWQEAGLGDAVVNSKAQFSVLLESPFSQFAKTRALANRVTHNHWQEKITVQRLKELSQYDNVRIKITEDAVNCSLFFNSNSVFYDPYLWAKPTPALRTENNFWVFEFRKQEHPDKDYECYSLLEKHFDFLLENSISLEEFLGENNENFNKNTEEFQKTLSYLLEKK